MFNAVQFERRNGLPVFIQPRHVAAFEPLVGSQVTETQLILSDGTIFALKESPSEVSRKLRAGV